MKISDVDPNLKAANAVSFEGKDCYCLPDEHFDVHGVFYDEENGRYCRMPLAVAQQVSEELAYLTYKTAGGRVRFATDSVFFGISATYEEFCMLENTPVTNTGGYVLFEELEDGARRLMGIFYPGYGGACENSFSKDITLFGGKMRNYVLYLPTFNNVEKLTLAFDKGANVGPSNKPYANVKPILYYGSSITNGLSADRPDNIYEAFINKWNNVDYICHGYSGRCKGEDCIVDYLTTIDTSLFVCDYDHNAPDVAHLEKTHLRLYERYRAVRPDVPIIFISKPDWDWDPEGVEYPARREVIRRTYEIAKSRGDDKVWFIDGETLFGKQDRESCTADGCHPNTLGFYRMASVIIDVMGEIDPVFGRK